MVSPTPRSGPYEAYWRLAAERQKVFFARLRGQAAPWSADPIISEYKFCNAYRASDRVSQYLIRDVIYAGGHFELEDTLLRIVFFRLFSKIETWQALEGELGPITVASFDPQAIDRVLERRRGGGEAIYTSAFILCANNAYGHKRKHRNHLALLEHMLAPGSGQLAGAVSTAGSLRGLYEALAAYPLIGPFMAYQLAIDINYSELVDFSESEFTVPGPGALRGIAKCFSDRAGLTPAEIISWMVANQEGEFARLGIEFEDLWGRPLQAIDCQNLFCETDKYARVAFPELASNRTQIKARFRPSSAGDIAYFYPPKWGLNELIKTR